MDIKNLLEEINSLTAEVEKLSKSDMYKAEGEEPEDPRAELVRRLLEYEQMKLAAAKLNEIPQFGRDFLKAQIYIEQSLQPRFPDVHVLDLSQAWADILKRAKLVQHHKITRLTGHNLCGCESLKLCGG